MIFFLSLHTVADSHRHNTDGITAYLQMSGEDSMTMDERIQWLRDRGVQIELKEKLKPVGEEEVPSDNSMTSVTMVFIPASDKEACEEVRIRVLKNGSGDKLLTALKPVFATDHDVDPKLLADTASKQFGNMELKVPESTLQKVVREGNVETFALSRPSHTNGSHGVNIYLDEAGQLKGLPPNRRASGLADLCGFKNVPFVGDVFVGRVRVTKDGIQNVDFLLQEMSSDAPWLKGVEAENYAFGVSTNQVSMNDDTDRIIRGEDDELGYVWQEDISTIDVSIRKPLSVSSSKDIDVKFSSKAVSISLRDGSWTLSLNLKHAISSSECTWTVNASHIEVSLEKAEERIWKELIEC